MEFSFAKKLFVDNCLSKVRQSSFSPIVIGVGTAATGDRLALILNPLWANGNLQLQLCSKVGPVNGRDETPRVKGNLAKLNRRQTRMIRCHLENGRG